MKIDFNEEQIKEIKYLYENTLYTIEQIAKKFNTSWNKISFIIHQYNIVKSKELKHQILVNRNNKRWSNMTKEERSENARKGHLKKLGDYKKEIYKKVGNKVSLAYHNKSQQEKERLAKEHSEKVILYWENLDEDSKQDFINKQKELWTDEKRAEHGQKISNKYKSQSESEKVKRRKVTSVKSKEMWDNMPIEKRLLRNKHLSISITNVWQHRSKEEKDEIYSNIFNTMRRNKSFSISTMENKLNDLFKISNFDYLWQYRVKNFWFDFKIIQDNKITLIELNGKYWHYIKPFNNTIEDIQIYEQLINSNISQYLNIAKKWRYTDVNKLNYCKNNNINFVAIYYDSIEQIDEIYNFILENLNRGIKILIL